MKERESLIIFGGEHSWKMRKEGIDEHIKRLEELFGEQVKLREDKDGMLIFSINPQND